jgi:hypothetical protein
MNLTSLCCAFSLICVAVVYAVVGAAVQRFVFKRTGVEMIPNSGLWLALPGLLRVPYYSIRPDSDLGTPLTCPERQDGHKFVFNKVICRRGQSSYQEV